MEGKEYDWHGRQVRRKPTPLEEKALPRIADAQEQSKEAFLSALLFLRSGLIKQGLSSLLTLEDYQSLTLTLPSGQENALREMVVASVRKGADLLMEELRYVTNAKANKANDDEFDGIVDRIFQAIKTAFLNLVKSRLLASYSHQLLRSQNRRSNIEAVAAEMRAESSAGYEATAAGAAFESLAQGRRIEAAKNADLIERYKRSELLDKNTCDPCRELDGKESTEPDVLPWGGYEFCDGTWRCRGVLLLIGMEAYRGFRTNE